MKKNDSKPDNGSRTLGLKGDCQHILPMKTGQDDAELLLEILRGRAKSDAMRLARMGLNVVPKNLTPFTCIACLDRDLFVGLESKRKMPHDIFMDRNQLKEKQLNRRYSLRPFETANQLPSPLENSKPLFGAHVWPDGDYYIGWWLNQKRHGKGTLSKATGETYSGQWKDGFMDGKGLYRWEDGAEYIGSYKRGFREGRGKLVQKTKTYVGEWRSGKREGFGIQTYDDGSEYRGPWENDRYGGGNGCFSYANGGEFDGEWKDGKRHGYGKMTYANGAVYEGEWREGYKHGVGKQQYQNTNRYEGNWKNGKESGKGTFFYVEETVMTENGMKFRYRAGDRHEGREISF
jgi:hypothetical protein